MLKVICFLIAFLVISLPGGMAAPTVKQAELLYVHNSRGGDVSVISIPGHEVINTIKLGAYIDYVTASPAGDIVYANRIDAMPGVPAGLSVGETGELIAISTATDEILWRLKLEHMPHHMTVSRDGKYVFVPYYDSWWVAVVDVEKRAVIKKIFVGNGSHVTKLSPDGRRLYVGSMMNDLVSVIDTAELKVIRQIAFDEAVRPFAITNDEKRMYVQLSRFHGFVVMDLDTGKKIRTVNLPSLPAQTKLPEFYPNTFNHGIILTKDEKLLFANGSVADYVAVYSHPELNLIKTIPVGRDPNYSALSKSGSYLYVTNRGSNDLSIISVEQLKEINRVKLGNYPQRMVVVAVPDRRR